MIGFAKRSALLLLLLLVGCGPPAGPTRYPISGEVIYNGQPVPAGAITFEPDTAKGNSGPGATGEIRGGRFSLAYDEGTVGGPHIVRITGYDGRTPPGGEGGWKALGDLIFKPYATTLDVPKASSTHRLEVPAQR